MIALDTNVIVRFLVKDDEAQAAQALRLIASQPVYLTLALLMETEWVLRKVYGYTAAQIHDAFELLVRLEYANFDHPASVRLVLDLFGAGFDFADAVHLALAKPAQAFATFDKVLARLAGKKRNLVPVLIPQ
ncbi:MAG: type II toxin-antitoxin system VapC family toxin [Hyphomicrobiaceae bacterium]